MKKIENIKEECLKIMKNYTDSTVCFTGNRDYKLPWGKDKESFLFLLTKLRVKAEIEKAIANGKCHFISGMALGVDLMCAEIVLDLKGKYPQITLEYAIPCKDQDKKWTFGEKRIYNQIISKADKVWCGQEEYTSNCMQLRNRYMVDNSSMVIAVDNGVAGGTKSTIRHAKKLKREIVVIDPSNNNVTDEDAKMLLDNFFEIEKKEYSFFNLLYSCLNNFELENLIFNLDNLKIEQRQKNLIDVSNKIKNLINTNIFIKQIINSILNNDDKTNLYVLIGYARYLTKISLKYKDIDIFKNKKSVCYINNKEFCPTIK